MVGQWGMEDIGTLRPLWLLPLSLVSPPYLRGLCARDFRFPASFSWSTDGTEIIGQTPTGRTTIAGLRLNDALIVTARSLWTGTGFHPPHDE